MIILGIDPGTATTGFAILNALGDKLTAIDYGIIRTAAGKPAHHRLLLIHTELTDIIRRHRPDVLVTEQLFFAKNQTTVFGVGRAIGVALLAAAQNGLEWCEYTPPEVKQAVVGYGNAEKHQVQYMVQRLLNLPEPPKPDDAADALAIAICHAHSAKLLRAGR